MKIRVGTSYYPESWDEKRVAYDARLMAEAGITAVRMGEFAWSSMEKRDGEFDFSWLQNAVEIFAQWNIKTVLCTPSSAAPAWLCEKYPEILRETRTGEKAWFGVRDHTCYTSKIYRKYITRVVKKMAEAFRDCPHIIAWQVDNEMGCSRFPECFCKECQEKFRKYLRKKYRTIENLNKCWATTFWSGGYTSWEEIKLESFRGNMGSCLTLATYEFRSFNGMDFVRFQAEIIRSIIPEAVVGTNNYVPHYDRYQGFADLDFAGEDLYPNSDTPLAESVFRIDLYRGILPGRSPWMLETPPCPGGPLYDFTKLYFWLFTGHGYDHIFYFLWLNHPAGNEKTHKTILTQYGAPGLLYTRIKELIHEADKVLKKYPSLPPPRPKTALLYDYHAGWIYTMTFGGEQAAYHFQQQNFHEALFRTGHAPEIISSSHDFSSYNLIVLPLHAHVEKSLAEKLEKYVENGGIVLMNGRSGMYDRYSKNLTRSGPEYLKELFGMEMADGLEHASQGYMPRYPEPCKDLQEALSTQIVAEGKLDGRKVAGCVSHWIAGIHLKGAKSLLTYRNSIYKNMPFLTVNRYGKGYALYCGADLMDKELTKEIIKYCERLASLPVRDIPENVDIVFRGKLAFIANFNKKPIEFPAFFKGKNIMGKALEKGIIHLGAMENALVEADCIFEEK